MKLRYFRTLIMEKGETKIYSHATLQYWSDEESRWLDVPVLSVPVEEEEKACKMRHYKKEETNEQ